MSQLIKAFFLINFVLFALACSKKVEVNPQDVSAEHVLEHVQEEEPSQYIIDVRTPDEYQSGHVPGAVNIPHDALLADESLLDLYKDKGLIFYCQSGRRAGLVMDQLDEAKYNGLHHMAGDIQGWKNKKLPLVIGQNPL